MTIIKSTLFRSSSNAIPTSLGIGSPNKTIFGLKKFVFRRVFLEADDVFEVVLLLLLDKEEEEFRKVAKSLFLEPGFVEEEEKSWLQSLHQGMSPFLISGIKRSIEMTLLQCKQEAVWRLPWVKTTFLILHFVSRQSIFWV